MSFGASRLLVVVLLPLGGCELVSTLIAPGSAGAGSNVQLCRDYVAHMNELEPCLGLSYDADNFCDGLEGQQADLGPFYQCLVENTSCVDDQPTMTVEGCSPPLASSGPASHP